MRRLSLILPLVVLALPPAARANSQTCQDQTYQRAWADHVVETGLGCQAAEQFALSYIRAGHLHGHTNLHCHENPKYPNIRCVLFHEGVPVGHVDFVRKVIPGHVNTS